MDQPGQVVNPARGQLKRENIIFPCPRSRLRIWSRETGSAVPSRASLLISILRLNLGLMGVDEGNLLVMGEERYILTSSSYGEETK